MAWEYVTVDIEGETARKVRRYAELYGLTIAQAATELIEFGADSINDPISDRDQERAAEAAKAAAGGEASATSQQVIAEAEPAP